MGVEDRAPPSTFDPYNALGTYAARPLIRELDVAQCYVGLPCYTAQDRAS